MILFKVNFSFLEVFSAEKNGEIVEFSCLHKKRIHGFKHKTVNRDPSVFKCLRKFRLAICLNVVFYKGYF